MEQSPSVLINLVACFLLFLGKVFYDFKMGAFGSDLILKMRRCLEHAEAWVLGYLLVYHFVSKKKSDFPIPIHYPFYKNCFVPRPEKRYR